MSVPEAPGSVRGGEGLSEPPGQGPLGRRANPQSGRPSWQWERLLSAARNLCRRRLQSCKAVAKQFAARSVPRAAATASAPLRLQGRGRGRR